jgi:hypothetical protein
MDVRFGHFYSTPIAFVNLVPRGADRVPSSFAASTASTLIGKRLDNEFALDLSNRTPTRRLKVSIWSAENSNKLRRTFRKRENLFASESSGNLIPETFSF